MKAILSSNRSCIVGLSHWRNSRNKRLSFPWKTWNGKGRFMLTAPTRDDDQIVTRTLALLQAHGNKVMSFSLKPANVGHRYGALRM